jgi:nucleoside-diphosphate-sugar epimerase
MKNVLITGGAGFIGSSLAKYLLTKKINVKILDNLEYGYKDNYEDNLILKKNFILADVRDKNFSKYLKNVDTIFHFAGISSLPECESNPTKAYDVNTNGVVNVLNSCRNANVKRIIFASTSAIYENNTTNKSHSENEYVYPNLTYATTKYCAEQVCKTYAQNYGMDIIICRFFNVFGAHQDFKREYPPFTSYLVREILNNRKPIIYNTSNVKRDYIYADDLLQYLYLMGNDKRKYCAEIFNLCSNKGYSTPDITKTIYKCLNKKSNFISGKPIKF